MIDAIVSAAQRRYVIKLIIDKLKKMHPSHRRFVLVAGVDFFEDHRGLIVASAVRDFDVMAFVLDAPSVDGEDDLVGVEFNPHRMKRIHQAENGVTKLCGTCAPPPEWAHPDIKDWMVRPGNVALHRIASLHHLPTESRRSYQATPLALSFALQAWPTSTHYARDEVANPDEVRYRHNQDG